MVGPIRPQIVLFGSSIVQFSYKSGGWGAILADIYCRRADIVLRGYAGFNSRNALQVLDQVFPKDAAVQPSLVIVYFGGNDSIIPSLSQHVPLLEYTENMRKIAIHLKSLSEKTRIIFLSTPPVNEERLSVTPCGLIRTNKISRMYSDACLNMCREVGVQVIDMWTAMQQADDWLNDCFELDGIHLSAGGSRVFVKEILKVIREADWQPSLHWRSLTSEFIGLMNPDPEAYVVLHSQKSAIGIAFQHDI